MARGKKTGGRTPGTPNKLTGEMREALGAVLGGEIDQLPKFLAKLDPKDRLDVVVKLLEFALPRLKGIEATIEQPEQDKPRFNLGLLTPEERQGWYKLYDKATGKSNGQADVEHHKNQDHGY